MKREIKFRAWDANENKMFEPSSISWKDGTIWACDAHGENKLEYELVNPNTMLMQYTGEPDETGKDIYEGDIVEEEVETEYGKEKIKHDVTFNAGAFYPICMQPSTTFKIIGNVHEHPELMTGRHGA